MVNASLNWGSIFGIMFILWGLIASPLAVAQLIIFLESSNRDNTSILKIIYILILTPIRVLGSLFVGSILFFQGWRLDPILQFGIFVLTFMYLSESAFGFLRDLVKLLKSKSDRDLYLKS